MKPQHIRAPCQLNAEKFDFTIKIILIGDLRVGKTTFLHRYLTGQYNAHLKQNDGIGARTKVIERDGRRILLRLWDTAGQERFRSLTSSHYRDVQGCLIMYDVTQSKTFDSVQRWYHDLQDKSDPTPKAVLVGTKCHLYREVDRERAERLAENLEVPYVEASAELGLNVMEAFETLLQQIVVCLEERAARIKLSKEDNEKTEKWKCGCGCG